MNKELEEWIHQLCDLSKKDDSYYQDFIIPYGESQYSITKFLFGQGNYRIKKEKNKNRYKNACQTTKKRVKYRGNVNLSGAAE